MMAQTVFHIASPRLSTYRIGCRNDFTSVRSVRLPNTIRLASSIARRAVTMAPPMSPTVASMRRQRRRAWVGVRARRVNEVQVGEGAESAQGDHHRPSLASAERAVLGSHVDHLWLAVRGQGRGARG